ncbi:MAG: CHAT domain-containing tetratricopeptide repeat protein [Devosia sp.]
MTRWAAALLAVVLLALVALPAWADPADDLAARVAAIEAVLADKDGVAAEPLAVEALALAEATIGADSLEVANLNRLLGDAYFYQERFAEAEPHYRVAFALREKRLGTNDVDTAVSANDLAIILKRLKRFTESQIYYEKVLAIREGLFGENSPEEAKANFELARIIGLNGKGVEAAAMMDRAIAKAAIAYGPNDPTLADWMIEKAAILHEAGETELAETAYVQAIAFGESVYSPDDTLLAYARQSLGFIYYETGRSAQAVPLYRAALAVRETAMGPDAPATISNAYRLAQALWAIDEIAEAEAMFRRVLAARETSDGPASLSVADALRWIGRAAAAQNRRAEAEIVLKRALAISQVQLGPEDVLTGFDLIALGQLYLGQERFAEARPLLERAVAVFDLSEENRSSAAAGRMALSLLAHTTGDNKGAIAQAEASLADMRALHGVESRDAADVMLSLAFYQLEAGETDEAERLVGAVRDIYANVAPDSGAAVRATSQLGRIREAEGDYEAAIALHRSALATLTARYGAGSAEIQPALADLGNSLFGTGDIEGAAKAFAQAAAIVERLAAVDSETAFLSRTGDVEDQAIARARVFDDLIKANYRLAESVPEKAADYSTEAFAAAQRVTESEAAGALAQMAARQAAGSGELAALVRERQDLVAGWQRQDSALTQALADEAPDRDGIAALRQALDESDARIAAIDARLLSSYPGFAALQRPAALSAEAVQARLGDNEVLLFFADTGALAGSEAETFLWIVPKAGEMRWLRLSRTSGELSAAVRELRNSMGVGAVTRGPNAVARQQGSDRTSKVLEAAHALYGAVLGEAEAMIAGRDLVIVPSRSLSALPFHALVAELPPASSADRYRDARWVAREHAITILPSVASLSPETENAGATEISRTAYVAFANPLLVGRRGTDRRAFNRTGCAPVIAVAEADEEIALPAPSALFRGAEADVAAVRALPPLPETIDEVCAIAELLGADAGALHLGAEASEANVKDLSAHAQLAQARVVHFATHGLVAGDLSGLAEPAIVLTPPETASTDDDGLLTASEVTLLKLDADWVILSACNTAASDGGGEALSGLARAFFYAGARALMVSHWPVSSGAAVRLASGAMAELSASPEIGRAEALRRAMVTEIEAGGARADPASWAPFIVVGASR